MSYAEELRKARDEKFNEDFKKFVDELKPDLEAAAKEGYSGFKIKVGSDNNKLFSHPKFVDKLKDELQLSVTFKNVKKQNLLGSTWTDQYLSIQWGENVE